MPVALPAPPYALATTTFAFPALAALAARSPLGGARETALACYLAARLGSAVAPAPLAHEILRERADAARAWLTAQAVPAATRSAIAALINATATGDPAATAAELESVRTAAGGVLDPAASAELARLAERVRG